MTKEFLQLRNEINKIDNQIVLLLKKRLKIVGRIKKYKLSRSLPLEEQEKEEKVICSKIEKSGLPKPFIKKIFSLIVKESRGC